MARPTQRGGDLAGFTLLELLAVMAVLGVLMGLGVGLLQRKGGELDTALAAVRDSIRVASVTSRARHLPTEVVVQPSVDGNLAWVQARVLQPVGHWHMEDTTSGDDDAGVDAVVMGIAEPGRFGMARRPELDRQVPLLTADIGRRPVFDLREGFAVRVDLKLDVRDEMVVARLGSSLSLKLDRDLIPEVRFVGTEGAQRTAGSVEMSGTVPLRVNHWHTLQVVHDRRRLRLLVDDAEVASRAAPFPLLQTDDDRFEVSPGDVPVVGLVDEVMVLAYDLTERLLLPEAVQLVADPQLIQFDRNGDLRRPASFLLSLEDDERTYSIGPGGIIQ